MLRNRIPLTVALVAAGALAAPALAAAPKDPKPGEMIAAIPLPAKEVAVVAEVAREARRKQRARAEGPVFPIEGKPDFGTADNAFGAARYGHAHSGQDMFAPTGTPLVAVTDAVVDDAGTDGGQGNYVHLYDADVDRTYIYMHMVSPPNVKTGDSVDAGDQLGGVGCTGSCWGAHLHFEVRDGKGWGGAPQDPMPLLEEWLAKSG